MPEALFPRTRSSDKGSIILHAPQIKSWDKFDTLTATLAFQIEVTGTNRRPFGTVNYSARTEVDLGTRTVLLFDLKINELNIPGIFPYEVEYSILRSALNGKTSKVPLDLILEYLPADLPVNPTPGLGTKPPPLFVSTRPAILLSVDAKPIFIPAGESGLEFVLNANWSVFREKGGKTLYLYGPAGWLTPQVFEGPWNWATSLPAAFAKLPEDPNWADARAGLPVNLATMATPSSAPMKVICTWEPAELILFEGEPRWESLGATGIEAAANSAAEIYRLGKEYYFLGAGRWFRSPQLEGDWAMQTRLPEAFQAIPSDHAKAYIRSSIPGTREAWEAAILATIPLSAKFDRRAAADLAPVVSYAGKPVFIPIEGTSIEQAISTSYQVLKFAGRYYVCYNATWFISENPDGPWMFADTIPAEFAKIPPASPLHNTTYVTVAESDADSVVYSSTAGYTNSYNPNTDTSLSRRGYYDFDDNEGWSQRVTRRGDEWLYAESEWNDGHMNTQLESSRGGQGEVNRQREGDQTTGSGSFQTGNGQQIDTQFSREKQGDTIVTDRTISGESRSAQITGAVQDGQGAFQISGSEGGTGTVTRELEDGQLTGSGSFTKNGKTIESDTTRSAEGVKREFESSEGGKAVTGRQGEDRGFVGQTGSGDVYAGHNGEVYKKSDSGWEQVDPAANAAVRPTQSETASRGSAERAKVNTASASPSNNRISVQSGSSGYQQLERDRQSRQRGFSRYDSYEKSRSAKPSRSTRGGRRR